MGIAETLFLYLLIGAVVATASALLTPGERGAKRAGSFLLTVPFWPLFAPFLLARASTSARGPEPRDLDLEARISAAERRLLTALESLDGVAEEVLAPEVERVRGLGDALRTMARRAAEMERMLDTPELSRARAAALLADLAPDDPRARSLRARLANIERLEAMRARTLDALESALFEIEEIGSRTALLRFADRPEEEAIRMIRDIAVSVEGASEGLLAGDPC